MHARMFEMQVSSVHTFYSDVEKRLRNSHLDGMVAHLLHGVNAAFSCCIDGSAPAR